MKELAIKIESKVLANNLSDFEQQAEKYLSGLTAKFESDDDFVRAKEEVKELKELEERTKAAIDAAINDSAEVKSLIDSAQAIVERFRAARLERDRLVKSKEKEVREGIISKHITDMRNARSVIPAELAPALEITMPESQSAQRLRDAAKGKRTLAGLEKGVAAEDSAITAEMFAEIQRIKERREMIPAEYKHLFADAAQLLAGTDDLSAIVAERIAQEEQRQEEARKAEEARQAEEAEKASKAEEERQARETVQQAPAEPNILANDETAGVESDASEEESHEYMITLTIDTTESHAITVAREIKQRYGNNVKLTRSK